MTNGNRTYHEGKSNHAGTNESLANCVGSYLAIILAIGYICSYTHPTPIEID